MTNATLQLGTSRGPLNLDRTPIYLRFVVTGGDFNTLDALDQLDDHARKGETIIPAKMDGGVGWIHLCCSRNGRRYGERRQFCDYRPVECELTQEQLANNEDWTKWCMAQAGKAS